MKAVTPAFQALLAEPVTSMVECWRLDRRDGVRLGFVLHDRPLRIDGLLYRAMGADTASAIARDGGSGDEGVSLSGSAVLTGLSERDMLAGRFDGAAISLFLVDWQQPEAGTLSLFDGELSQLRFADDRFEAEVVSLDALLSRPLGGVFSAECRALLGDGRCKVSLRSFTDRATVTGLIDRQSLRIDGNRADDWFAGGLVRAWTGNNAGLEMEIARHQTGRLDLFRAMPADWALGDRLELVAGCDKRLDTCRSKFNNAINFRGDPFVPGQDAVLSYATP